MRRVLPALALAGLACVAPAAGQTATPPASSPAKKMTPPPPAAPRPFEFPTYTTRKLPNGLTVFVIEDHRQPLVSYSLQILAGNLNVPPPLSGLANMTAGLLREGTATRSSQDIAKLVDNAGGSLSASAGDDVTVVNATFMKSYAALGIDLLSDVALRPAFAQEEIDRQMQQAQSGLAINYNDPEYLLPVVAARSILGTHPYAYPGDGTPASLRKITREQIVDFHKRHFAPSNAWLAIAGDVNADEAFALAEKHLGAWKADAPAAVTPPAPPAPKPQVVIVDKSDAVQTQIAVGHLGIARNHPDFLTLQVANQIFGGSFNSRVNMKLRANEGLTYGAGSSFDSQRLGGTFEVTTFTRTEKTADAVKFIVELVKEWIENPATEAELAEAKAYMAGSYGVALETSGAVAGRVVTQAVYGLAPDYYTRYRERVLALTIDQVRAAVKRHIQPANLTVVAVGNAKEFSKALEAYGPAKVIPLLELDPLAAGMVREKEVISASPASAAEAKALIEAAAGAIGGKDKILAVKDITIRGKIKLSTPQGEMEADAVEMVALPDKYKLTLTLMGMSIVQASDGQAAYMAQGPNVREVPANLAAEFSKSALTTGAIGLLQAALNGSAEVVSIPEGGVLWKQKDFEVKIYFNEASKRISKLAYRAMGMQGPADAEISFTGYKETGGLWLPASETIVQNGQKAAERTVTAHEINTGLTADAFKKPAQ